MPGRRSLGLEVALCAALLAACGGGGGGGETPVPVSSTLDFPLRAAYTARTQAGYSVDFNVSGSCSGTAAQTSTAAVPATFEGVVGFSVTRTQSITLPSCGGVGTLATTATSTDHFDADFGAIGSTTGTLYGVYQPSPAVLPPSVRVGDAGTFGTETLYADSSKTAVVSSAEIGWEIGPDTATSAIGTLTTRAFDADGNPVFTEQDRYRIAADGSLTLLSFDIQYAGANGLHLVLTPR